MRIEYRLYHNIKVEGDCWIWQGAKNNIGYGMIREHISKSETKMRTTHRVSAELNGMDIEDKCVLHTCKNHACVNPNHLYTGTKKEVFATRTIDPNKPFGRPLGSKTPTKQCPYCIRHIPRNMMPRHISCKHPGINTT